MPCKPFMRKAQAKKYAVIHKYARKCLFWANWANDCPPSFQRTPLDNKFSAHLNKSPLKVSSSVHIKMRENLENFGVSFAHLNNKATPLPKFITGGVGEESLCFFLQWWSRKAEKTGRSPSNASSSQEFLHFKGNFAPRNNRAQRFPEKLTNGHFSSLENWTTGLFVSFYRSV